MVPSELVSKAVKQLVKFSQKTKQDNKNDELFDENEAGSLQNTIDVVLQFKKYLAATPSNKPKLIKLESSLYPIGKDSEFKICLIIRDDVVTSENELEKIEAANIPYLLKILTVKEIAKEHKTFDQKRLLAKSYDLFLADTGAITNLPAVLGKVFYGSSKAPIPIRIMSSTASSKKFSVEVVKNQILNVLSSVYYTVPVASSISIPVGNLDLIKPEELVKNAQKVLEHFATSQNNNGSDNEIRSAFIKLRNSPALPLYYNEKVELSASKEESKPETTKSYDVDDESVIPKGVKLSKFEQSLLELGLYEGTPDFVEKKAKKASKRKSPEEKENALPKKKSKA